jgi:AraC-like DNA-binding protein
MARPHGRADYHLLFNVSGEIVVNGETLCEGEAYLIFPGEKQEYTYVNRENALYYWLHFSGAKVAEMLEFLSVTRGKHSLIESKGEAEEIIRRMIKAISDEWDGADSYAVGQMYSLMALVSKPRRNENPFAKAIKRLSAPNDKTSVSELAASYSMSESHFIRQFKFYTGSTPLEYRSNKIITNAKSLLSGTDMPITDISESLGFDDPLYFSRFFKKRTGISPREYRKKYI